MGFIAALVVCVLIGWMAQSWKGRTGVVWSVITAVLMFGIMFISFTSSEMHNPGLMEKDSGIMALWLVTILIGGGIMAVVVATLPSKKKNNA
jgi:hypothetical protein